MISVRTRLVSALLFACAAAPRPGLACDTTGCLFMTRSASGLLAKKAWRLDLSFRATDDSLLMSGSDTVDRVRRPKVDFENGLVRPGFHQDLGGQARFLQIDGGYGVTARTTVFASAPVYTNRSYHIGHPPVLSETYQTWGMGDTLLGVRQALLVGPAHSLVGGLGVEIPTGAYRLVAPAALFDIGVLDPMLQPGSGSFDVVGSLQYSLRLGAGLDLVGGASYQANTTNDLEYRYGNDAILSLSLAHPVISRLRASVQFKVASRGRSEFRGEGVASTGGTIVYAIPGLSATVPGRLSVYAFVPLPVYRYVNEAQLAPSVSLVIGVGRTF